MKPKDKYLAIEFLFTFLLLYAVISLLMPAVSSYKLYLIFGLLIGFGFSWASRGKAYTSLIYVITFLALGVLFYMFNALLNSTFYYKDVVIIGIRSAFLLIICLSFNASSAHFLNYIQMVSLPLFMSHPVLIKEYNESVIISIAVYFICWLAVLRGKLYGFSEAIEEKKPRRYYPFFLLAAFFIMVIFIATIVFLRVPMGEGRKKGVLPEVGMGEDFGLDIPGKEYYELQDKIQSEIADLVTSIESREDRYKTLKLLSSLIKESPDTIEADNSERGLTTHIKNPGLGIEKRKMDYLARLIKLYMNKKVIINMGREKDNLMDRLRRTPLNIKTRLFTLLRINDIHSADFYKDIRRNVQDLRKIIKNAELTMVSHGALSDSIGKFKDWKAFEVYRRSSDALKTDIESMPKPQPYKEFLDAFTAIDKMKLPADIKDTKDKIEKLSSANKELQYSKPINKANEVFNIKTDMILSQIAQELKEKIEDAHLSQTHTERLKSDVDTAVNTEDYRQFKDTFRNLEKMLKDNQIAASKALAKTLSIKVYLFSESKKEEIKDILKDSVAPDKLKEEFLSGIDKLMKEPDLNKMNTEMQEIQSKLEELLKPGFISRQMNDELNKKIEELKEILVSIFPQKMKPIAEQQTSAIYQKSWEDLINSLTLEDKKKEVLNEFKEQLANAKTISWLEDIKEAFRETLEDLIPKELKKEDAKSLEKEFNDLVRIRKQAIIAQTIFNLHNSIEPFKETNPEEFLKIEQRLNALKNSSTDEELKNNLEKLKEYLDAEKKDKDKKIPEEPQKTSLWELYIMPSFVVMPEGAKAYLMSIAVYDKVLFREVGPELEWFSSAPQVVSVDGKGMLRSLSKGKTTVFAKYRGINSNNAEITVVDNLAQGIDAAVRKELGR